MKIAYVVQWLDLAIHKRNNTSVESLKWWRKQRRTVLYWIILSLQEMSKVKFVVDCTCPIFAKHLFVDFRCCFYAGTSSQKFPLLVTLLTIFMKCPLGQYISSWHLYYSTCEQTFISNLLFAAPYATIWNSATSVRNVSSWRVIFSSIYSSCMFF